MIVVGKLRPLHKTLQPWLCRNLYRYSFYAIVPLSREYTKVARVRLVCSDVLVDNISLSGPLFVQNRETDEMREGYTSVDI